MKTAWIAIILVGTFTSLCRAQEAAVASSPDTAVQDKAREDLTEEVRELREVVRELQAKVARLDGTRMKEAAEPATTNSVSSNSAPETRTRPISAALVSSYDAIWCYCLRSMEPRRRRVRRISRRMLVILTRRGTLRRPSISCQANTSLSAGSSIIGRQMSPTSQERAGSRLRAAISGHQDHSWKDLRRTCGRPRTGSIWPCW